MRCHYDPHCNGALRQQQQVGSSAIGANATKPDVGQMFDPPVNQPSDGRLRTAEEFKNAREPAVKPSPVVHGGGTQQKDLIPIWERTIQHPVFEEEPFTNPVQNHTLGKANETSILKSLMGSHDEPKEGWNKTSELLHPDNDLGHAPSLEHHIEAAKIVDGTHEHLATANDVIAAKAVEAALSAPTAHTADLDVTPEIGKVLERIVTEQQPPQEEKNGPEPQPMAADAEPNVEL